MFDDVLGLAARIDAVARDVRPAPPWVAHWREHIPWPVPMLMDSPNPPKPWWPQGARWLWDDWGSVSEEVQYSFSRGEPVSVPPLAVLQASEFLVDVKWERQPAESLVGPALRRVSTIARLELDARLDDALAGFPGTTATRARSAAASAESKRNVAGDVNMTLGRIPGSWQDVVFRPTAGGTAVRGKW